VPEGTRSEPLTLEEVRALSELASDLSTALTARAALGRGREREAQARAHAEAAVDATLLLSHALDRVRSRDALAAARLARAAVGPYSAGGRLAVDAIERRVARGAPVVLVAAPGADPIPWLARAHLGGPRGSGPFVVVEGTRTAEHDETRWRDEAASPLCLADGGLLVLRDAAALPEAIQALIARATAERRAPWERAEPLDLTLALVMTEAPSALVARGRLVSALADRLADAAEAPIAVPPLADRPEDLRAALVDRVAREGLGALSAPCGIEPAALALLLEHPFPGEDAELEAVVVRLVAALQADEQPPDGNDCAVARAAGAVVRAADVKRLGLSPGAADADPNAGPPPSNVVRLSTRARA
jgi:transcriptional regulator of acetoin/glycerol metabolism